jgi:hypothetical protein
MAPQLEQLTLGADPAAWGRAGFTVTDAGFRAGAVGIAFGGGEGILGWRLDRETAELDGLPVAPRAEVEPASEPHPNGVTLIDHLVVFTPDLERTTRALEEIGVERRRVREAEAGGRPVRQGFFRLGEVILEVVERDQVEPGPARFWGITFAVADLEGCAELLGDSLGSIHDAVQPGRRIATMRTSAALGLAVALISEA